MRPILALACFLVFALSTRATHLIGGELFYTSLGNDDYEVTLKMYRDCGPGNTNQTGFDATAEIAAYDVNDVFVTSTFFTLGIVDPVPVTLNNPCLTPPSTICVEEASYTGTMHLPSGTGGYNLSYQRCCRSPVVINLVTLQGLTCTVHVPDPSVSGTNSSPHFTQYPPIALCVGQPMSFGNAATDPDGDVLLYDLCAPYAGADQFNPLPSPPLGPPFTTVVWANSYSVANMIDASPALAIDANSGQVTLTPNLIGSFAIAIRVKEFRNGVELSEVIRDFRFDVVPCVADIVSTITEQTELVNNNFPHTGVCDGLTVDMHNASSGANFYHWDFGVEGTLGDTSAEVAPSFTFPEAGIYTITLVANPGWPCADTSVSTFAVAPPVTVQFTPPPITCIDEQPVTLVAIGDFTPAAALHWDLGDGTAPDASSHTTHPTFPTLGTHVVHVTATENNCSADYTDSVVVFPRPVPLFSVDTAGCAPLDAQFSNMSTAWTPMTSHWTFGDDATSDDAQPMHTYVDQGYFTVSLTVGTDSGCIATKTLTRADLVEVWPQPIARFAVDPPVASLMDPTITVHDLSISAYHWDFTVEDMHYDTTSFTHTFDEAGWYTVRLTATSGLGCSDTASQVVFVGGEFFFAPNAFTPDGDDVNEVWLPSVRGARLYQLTVYDRWGQVRFSTTDPTQGWDGAECPTGVYVYKAWISEWGPLEKEFEGSVTLLR